MAEKEESKEAAVRRLRQLAGPGEDRVQVEQLMEGNALRAQKRITKLGHFRTG